MSPIFIFIFILLLPSPTIDNIAVLICLSSFHSFRDPHNLVCDPNVWISVFLRFDTATNRLVVIQLSLGGNEARANHHQRGQRTATDADSAQIFIVFPAEKFFIAKDWKYFFIFSTCNADFHYSHIVCDEKQRR